MPCSASGAPCQTTLSPGRMRLAQLVAVLRADVEEEIVPLDRLAVGASLPLLLLHARPRRERRRSRVRTSTRWPTITVGSQPLPGRTAASPSSPRLRDDDGDLVDVADERERRASRRAGHAHPRVAERVGGNLADGRGGLPPDGGGGALLSGGTGRRQQAFEQLGKRHGARHYLRPFVRLRASVRPCNLRTLPDSYAVVRLQPGSELPEWVDKGPFRSVTRTEHEVSVVCRDHDVPEGESVDRGFTVLEIDGAARLLAHRRRSRRSSSRSPRRRCRSSSSRPSSRTTSSSARPTSAAPPTRSRTPATSSPLDALAGAAYPGAMTSVRNRWLWRTERGGSLRAR